MDAIGLLEARGSLLARDKDALRDWFARFRNMDARESVRTGRVEREEQSRTYHDLQVAIYVLYADQPAIAKRVLEEAREKRIDAQIAVRRAGTRSSSRARDRCSYSVMNIDGLTQLATVGDRVGVDLWNTRLRVRRRRPCVRRCSTSRLMPLATRSGRTSDRRLGSRVAVPRAAPGGVALSGC